MPDRVLVIESGKIDEQGQHHDLIERSGHYAEMYELQAANHR